MKTSKSKFLPITIGIIVILEILLFLLFLPPINIHSIGFWYFIAICIAPFLLIYVIRKNIIALSSDKQKFIFNKGTKTFFIIVIVLGVILAGATFIGTPLLGGLNSYKNRIHIPESSNFSDIEEFKPTQVQIIDKNISMSLADRVFGEMGAEMVSLYTVSDNYSSVVVNNQMYRLTPAEFGGLIKWIETNKEGTPGYISVNVTTGETQFIEVNQGLRYMPYAHLFKNLYTHLRLHYPTFIFGNTKFEVDDNWNPYWVTQVCSYRFVGKAKDIVGVIVTDPISGENNYYDVNDVPSWVDNIYDAETISEQYNSYGRYINGLLNFSQKGETAVTDDYAYLQKNGHLWMYTGVTSVGSDESNIGFIYVDLQNKDVIYVISAGAEEYSARASAEGAVQEKGYIAVFPTVVSIQGQPVYFMGLKDNAGLIKAYGFVDYKNYQKVAVASTINEALKQFTGNSYIDETDINEITITVKEVSSAVMNGYTIYFIQTTDGNVYTASIEISNTLPFLKVNDSITIKVSDSTIIEIK